MTTAATYSERERDKGGKEMQMHRIFWTTLQIAVMVFLFSVIIAPSHLAPLRIGEIFIEPIILFLAMVICPIPYVIACFKDQNFHLDWAITYLAFFLFVKVVFPILFFVWLNISFNPKAGYVWHEDRGVYSYLPAQDIELGDTAYTKHAVVSPPAIDPP